MPVCFDSENKIFKLDTKTSSYIFQVFEEDYLIHLYYGAYIPDNGVEDLAMRCCNASFSPANATIGEHGFSCDSWPMEYPATVQVICVYRHLQSVTTTATLQPISATFLTGL